MEKIKIDHTKKKLSDAIGLPLEEGLNMATKLSKLSSDFIINDITPSQIAENLNTLFSDKELLWISTEYIIEKTNQFRKLVENDLEKVINLLPKKDQMN